MTKMTYQAAIMAVLSSAVEGQALYANQVAARAVAAGYIAPANVACFKAKLRQLTSPRGCVPNLSAADGFEGRRIYALAGEARAAALHALFAIQDSWTETAQATPDTAKKNEEPIVAIYVDGSYHEGWAGAGILIPAMGIAKAYPTPAADAASAERLAIAAAVRVAVDLGLSRIAIYNDARNVVSELVETFATKTMHPEWAASDFLAETISIMERIDVHVGWQDRSNMVIVDALAKCGRGRRCGLEATVSFPGCEVSYGRALGRFQSLGGGVADRVFSATGMREGEMWSSRRLEDIERMLAALVQSEVIANDERPQWSWTRTASRGASGRPSAQSPKVRTVIENGIAVHVSAMLQAVAA